MGREMNSLTSLSKSPKSPSCFGGQVVMCQEHVLKDKTDESIFRGSYRIEIQTHVGFSNALQGRIAEQYPPHFADRSVEDPENWQGELQI